MSSWLTEWMSERWGNPVATDHEILQATITVCIVHVPHNEECQICCRFN